MKFPLSLLPLLPPLSLPSPFHSSHLRVRVPSTDGDITLSLLRTHFCKLFSPKRCVYMCVWCMGKNLMGKEVISLRLCVHARVQVCICVLCVSACYMCACVYVCVCVCVYVCACTCMCVCVRECIYVWVCICDVRWSPPNQHNKRSFFRETLLYVV